MSRRIKLVIEYDGTNYCGWQRQKNALSVQQAIEDSLKIVVGHYVLLYSSGRTDAGVHAKGMVAVFDTSVSHPLSAFIYGVNNLLPEDISIVDASEADSDFNPRRDAVSKHYRYTICTSSVKRPLYRKQSWLVKKPLNIELIKSAAESLVGEHDFASYRASGCSAETSVRTIYSVRISESDEFIYLDIIGSGFLRNMVRKIAGTLVDIGSGRLSPSFVRESLENPGMAVGQTAPPQGLCLEKVHYSRDGLIFC